MSDASSVTAAPVAVDPRPPRYDAVAISLHWATVGFVVVLWLIAQAWDFAPSHSPTKLALRSLHVSLGLLFAVVLLARILWRAGPSQRPAPAERGLAGLAARAVHFILYVVLATQVVSGILVRWGLHDPLGLFGLFTIPAPITLSKTQAHQLLELHDTLATVILIVAGLHAAAALVHHYVLRDDVLRRMLPRRAASPDAASR